MNSPTPTEIPEYVTQRKQNGIFLKAEATAELLGIAQ